MTRLIAALCMLFIASGCAHAPVSPTGFPYVMAATLPSVSTQTLIVAPISYGIPSRRLLSRSEPWARSNVEVFLKANGAKIVPSARFTSSWKRATERMGEPYDAATGKLNSTLFNDLLSHVSAELKASSGVNLVIFVDIRDQSVLVGGSTGKHVARWHGVSREATLIGSGQPSKEKYEWNEAFDASSLYITATDQHANVVFNSAGGLELLEGVNLRSRQKERITNIFRDTDSLDQAIRLAFHPWVTMDGYPGRAQAALSTQH